MRLFPTKCAKLKLFVISLADDITKRPLPTILKIDRGAPTNLSSIENETLREIRLSFLIYYFLF